MHRLDQFVFAIEMIPQQIELRKFATNNKAKSSAYFFKTGPGQYGEGDLFIGVTVPENRLVAKKFLHSTSKELSHLLKSKIHEDRLLGLLILTEQYKLEKEIKAKKKIVDFMLKERKAINNWDLVDGIAASVVGDYYYRTADLSVLTKLAKSKHHWDKRIAMVSTLAFIRQGDTELAFKFAKLFLDEQEDLMHKAAGWMLREAGKKNLQGLKKFIDLHGSKMPRTMLRYSIEKFSETERKKILVRSRV